MTCAVMGAGAFGTALAIALATRGPVTLWARDAARARAIDSARVNAARLPDRPLPDNLRATADAARLAMARAVLVAVPMQRLRATLMAHRAVLEGRQLVLCCKGIELATGLTPSAVADQVLKPAGCAVLTGPSFAADIALGLPTALTLATRDPERGARLQAMLTTGALRLYRTTDVTGAEIGGALKNVIAIACGTAIGAGLGESARAALMTRGYAEMQRFALARGARAETLAGLSGFGDLALTCTSPQSRNFRLGLALGAGGPGAGETVEGAATAAAVQAAARAMNVEMPITEAVVGLLDGRLDSDAAAALLLSRSLKEE